MAGLLLPLLAAASIWTPATPQVEADATVGANQTLEVRLSWQELSTVTSSGPAPQMLLAGGLSTGDIRIENEAFSNHTGFVTLAINTGVGSVSQAATNVAVGASIQLNAPAQ